MLSGCRPDMSQSGSWKIYHNPRYDFTFPYPSTWKPSQPPDNRDGQAFNHPDNPAIEVRGWASNRLPNPRGDEQGTSKNATSGLKPNFKTQQGLAGELKVQIDQRTSSMTLTLIQGEVRYNWQGRSPSEQFADRYQLFYSMARQYRVPAKAKPL